MALRPYRALAIVLGVAVVAWQFVNLATGRAWHEYLVADLAASLVLIGSALIRPERRAVTGLLVGFSMFLGIFVAATTGKLIVGGAHPGTVAAGLGIVPCLVGVVGVGRRLTMSGSRTPGEP